MHKSKVFAMPFAAVYPLLLQKVERKGRSKDELDRVIRWLTGYSQEALEEQLRLELSYERFFAAAPQMNARAALISGSVCGVKVQEIEDPLMQKIRWLDKLVDELAKGRPMEKILR